MIINKNLKILVTGGAGFIGSHLAQKLVNQGFEVHIIDNLFSGKKENLPKGSIFHKVDIRNIEQLENVFKSIGDVKCLFHCAAIPMVQFSIDNPLESHSVNIDGTNNILNMSVKYKVQKVVYSASCSVYGDQKEMPFKESMLPATKSPYALQKYFGEIACQTYYRVYGLKSISLRYFNVYGYGQDPKGGYAMVIAKFLDQSRNKQPMTITGTGNQTRDFVFIDDVVDANILAMNNEKIVNGESINIGSGKNISIKDIANLIGGNLKYVEARLEPKDTMADITKAKKILNWQPKVDIKEGINIIKNKF